MPKKIENLVKGYKQFRKKYFEGDEPKFKELSVAQNPDILVIACSDSRVDPALIMGCEPGDLFVVRNVANLVPPYENDDTTHHGTSAALEFGINNLGIKHVIVLGHSACGGIQGLMNGILDKRRKQSFISKWMEIAKQSKIETEKEFPDEEFVKKVDHCGQKSIVNSLENLKTFPWIKEKIDNNELFIHGWFFDLKEGIVKQYNPEKSKFLEIEG